MLTLDDVKFSNKDFWTNFIMTSFPTSLDTEADEGLCEMIEENDSIVTDINWWTNFTKYYDGVLEESDGYIDDPETLVCPLTGTQTLKIEFHPGDTVFYVNNKQIGCTGGEYSIQVFPFSDLLKYMELRKDNRIFLLLLPMAAISKRDEKKAIKIISDTLEEVFDKRFCKQFAKCIVNGLVEE